MITAFKDFKNIFSEAQVKACFFHDSQNLWKKIQKCSLSSYFVGSDNDFINERRKSARDWFNGALGLALIPPEHIQNTRVDLMNRHTPDHAGETTFNDYIVSNYSSARFLQDS